MTFVILELSEWSMYLWTRYLIMFLYTIRNKLRNRLIKITRFGFAFIVAWSTAVYLANTFEIITHVYKIHLKLIAPNIWYVIRFYIIAGLIPQTSNKIIVIDSYTYFYFFSTKHDTYRLFTGFSYSNSYNKIVIYNHKMNMWI